MFLNLMLLAMGGVDLVVVTLMMRLVVSMDISKTNHPAMSVKQFAYKNPCVPVMLSQQKSMKIQIDVIFTEIFLHRIFSQTGNM